MIELIEANWLLILLAVLVGFVVAWFLMSGSRKTKVTRDEADSANTGAKRNQALIDSPPASAAASASAAPAAKDAAPPPPEPTPAPAPAAAKPTPAPTKPAPTKSAAAKPAASKPKASKVAPGVPPVSTGMAGAGAATGVAVAAKKVAKAPATADGDDLSRLKGVGPKLATQLQELGVTSFAQIAGWSEADIDRIDPQLGRFKGRIRRDNWVEQAKLLSSGDTAAYEARFGKL